jgi:Domain of unknown function (DUF4279)
MTLDVLLEDQKWYRVSLRLMGDGLPVDSIEERLHLAPSLVARKGEYMGGNPKRAKYGTNLWILKNLTSSEVSFESQIGVMLDILEPRLASLQKILSMPEVEGDLFLGFSAGNGQGGDYLSHHLLQRIVKCGLSVTLDLYPPSLDTVPHEI